MTPQKKRRGRPVRERPPEESEESNELGDIGSVDPGGERIDIGRISRREDPEPDEPPDEAPPGWAES